MDTSSLTALYHDLTGHNPTQCQAITGSGSNRQYYRLTADDGTSLIGVIGTSVEENQAFI